MLRLRTAVPVVVLALLVLPACGGDGDDAGDGTTDTGGGGAAEVTLSDFEIDAPASLAAGTTVQVRNTGEAPHTWTSEDGGWDSETVQPGEETTVTVPTAGTFDYVCTIHPDSMNGSLEVTG